MREPSQNLHKLIKSLSKSEKGYFLKTTKNYNSEDKQYIKLFNAIDAQKEYNETEIKDIFRNELFIQQLHVAKNYLFKIILKSLYLYNSESSLNYKFSEYISTISNLYSRGLYTESLKFILKAKAQAYQFEKFDNILEFIRWEKYITISLTPEDISEKLKMLSKEEFRVLDILFNIMKYRNFYSEIFSLLRKNGSLRGRIEEREYKRIINEPLMKSETNAMSYESKLLYFQVLIIYSQAESNDKNTYTYSGKLIKYMNSNPERINEFIKEYVFAMIENLSSSFNLGKYKESLEVINMLRNLKIKSSEQEEYIFLSTYVIQFLIYIVRCEFYEASLLIAGVEKKLNLHEKKEVRITELLLYQNIFYIYFALGEYEKALAWLNKILSTNFDIRQDIYSLAHIFNLLVHYELNNLELLSYAVVNTYRYLYKRKKLYKFEEIVLKFIRRISKADDITEEFKFLKWNLSKLIDDPFERIPLEYFDFISWLDSKISGLSFIEVKKKKIKSV